MAAGLGTPPPMIGAVPVGDVPGVKHALGESTERAGAGEQIGTGRAGQARGQPVEYGFAHAIRRGAQAGAIRDRHPPAAPVAADDAQRGDGLTAHGDAGRFLFGTCHDQLASVPPTVMASTRRLG